ncbi:MAG: VOC family protein [Pleurocapsa sp.]
MSQKLQVKFIRYLWLGIIGFILAIAPLASITVAQSPSPRLQVIAQDSQTEPLVKEVATVGMTVSNMEEAIAFYTQVLTFEVIEDVEVSGRDYELLQGVFGARARIVDLRLGEEIIELAEYLTPKGDAIPVDSQSNDLWFQHMAIVVSDMPEAYRRLRENSVQHVSTYPQKLPEYIEAAAGIEAFYFRDPDGHNLEIIAYPPDKGNPRWQKNTDDLFLGIDHTAIAISDTETSLNFYSDVLGLELAGESENYGTEQEHLNNVFGARLRISGLKADKGMAVEFLEYLAPPGGRPFLENSQTNDLWHWETTLVVNDIEQAATNLRNKDVEFISSGVVEIDEGLGFRQGLLIRDPDGHGIKIIER